MALLISGKAMCFPKETVTHSVHKLKGSDAMQAVGPVSRRSNDKFVYNTVGVG